MQSTHRGDATHARSNSGFVNEMKEPPTSAKSIKGWNNDGQSKALNQSPLKKLDAVYNHTKKDMESLERYINILASSFWSNAYLTLRANLSDCHA